MMSRNRKAPRPSSGSSINSGADPPARVNSRGLAICYRVHAAVEFRRRADRPRLVLELAGEAPAEFRLWPEQVTGGQVGQRVIVIIGHDPRQRRARLLAPLLVRRPSI